MNMKTIILALIVAVCCAGCNESDTPDAPKDYQLPDVDVATVEDKADAKKRGWMKLEPLALADTAEKK